MYTSITDFVVTFLLHPFDGKAHTHLNNLYSGVIDDYQRLYTDPSTEDELKDDVDLIPLIQKMISEELIAPTAVQTPDTSSITPIVQQAALYVEIGNNQRRLGKKSLTKALEMALAKGKDQVEIRVSTSHIYFDTRSGPINFLDWRLFSTTAIATTPPAAPATAVDIARAVASAIPAPPSASDLATAFASVYPATSSTSTPPAPAASSTTSSMYLFNPASLPSDVASRYRNKTNKGLILGSTTKTPFAGGYFYHLELPDKLIAGTHAPRTDSSGYILVPVPVRYEYEPSGRWKASPPPANNNAHLLAT